MKPYTVPSWRTPDKEWSGTIGPRQWSVFRKAWQNGKVINPITKGSLGRVLSDKEAKQWWQTWTYGEEYRMPEMTYQDGVLLAGDKRVYIYRTRQGTMRELLITPVYGTKMGVPYRTWSVATYLPDIIPPK